LSADLTIGEVAEHLQVDEAVLVAICERRAPITSDMAIRFAMSFGSTADAWLRMHNAFELVPTRKTDCEFERVERAA